MWGIDPSPLIGFFSYVIRLQHLDSLKVEVTFISHVETTWLHQAVSLTTDKTPKTDEILPLQTDHHISIRLQTLARDLPVHPVWLSGSTLDCCGFTSHQQQVAFSMLNSRLAIR